MPICQCDKKDKNNWHIIKPKKDNLTEIKCIACSNIWITDAQYADKLKYQKEIWESARDYCL